MYCAGTNIFANFRTYQSDILAQFRKIGREYNFITVDANRSVHELFLDLRQQITPVLKGMRLEF